MRLTWRCCFLIHNSCSAPRAGFMQISFVEDHQIFSLLSPFQPAECEKEEKTVKPWKGLFLWPRTDPGVHAPLSLALARIPSSAHSVSLFQASPLLCSLCSNRPPLFLFPPPQIQILIWSASLAWQERVLPEPILGGWPLHGPAARPSNPGSGLEKEPCDVEGGQLRLVCQVTSADVCVRTALLWQASSVWSRTDRHCSLISGLSARQREMHACRNVHICGAEARTPLFWLLWFQRPTVLAVHVLVQGIWRGSESVR